MKEMNGCLSPPVVHRQALGLILFQSLEIRGTSSQKIHLIMPIVIQFAALGNKLPRYNLCIISGHTELHTVETKTKYLSCCYSSSIILVEEVDTVILSFYSFMINSLSYLSAYPWGTNVIFKLPCSKHFVIFLYTALSANFLNAIFINKTWFPPADLICQVL